MKQQINLLAALPKQEIARFSARHFGRFWGAFLLFLLCLWGYEWVHGWLLQKDNQAIDQTLLQQQNTLVALSHQAGGQSSPNQEMDQKTKLLALVVQKEQLAVLGFSGFLGTLAEQPSADVWLTRLQIDNEGNQIQLTGDTLSGRAVLRWMTALNQTDVFQPRPLKLDHLTQSDDAHHSFHFSVVTAHE